MKPATLQLHIGRVVWHGSGAPDPQALAAAIEAALARALTQQRLPPGAPSAITRSAEAVVQQLLPALPAQVR